MGDDVISIVRTLDLASRLDRIMTRLADSAHLASTLTKNARVAAIAAIRGQDLDDTAAISLARVLVAADHGGTNAMVQLAKALIRAHERSARGPAPEPAPTRSGGLTFNECEIAARNFGIDLQCGSCASTFYTGFAGHPHQPTCKTSQSPKPL